MSRYGIRSEGALNHEPLIVPCIGMGCVMLEMPSHLTTALFISFVHAVTARLKIEQVFKYYWTVVSGLALVSLVLAWYGM